MDVLLRDPVLCLTPCTKPAGRLERLDSSRIPGMVLCAAVTLANSELCTQALSTQMSVDSFILLFLTFNCFNL